MVGRFACARSEVARNLSPQAGAVTDDRFLLVIGFTRARATAPNPNPTPDLSSVTEAMAR
jgi:hypothetical protein